MTDTSRSEIAEKSFVIAEERAFGSRARADRAAGRWVAGRLGLLGEAAESFAAETVAAGVRSRDGRGGFARLAAWAEAAGLGIEELRTRYAMALAAADLPAGFLAALAALAVPAHLRA